MESPLPPFIPIEVSAKVVPSRRTYLLLLLMNCPFVFSRLCTTEIFLASPLGPGCPAIHSLLFADDLILCGHASVADAASIKSIFDDFSLLSGQVPNFQKSSILFSKNVDDHTKSQIKAIFPVPDLLPNTIHLVHPMIFSQR